MNPGKYRDDGLICCFDMTPRQVELLKKKICQFYKEFDLSITIDANLKTVNFLDITMDLERGTFKPFMKENDKPLYVHKQSNHPKNILENIPLAVNKRLSSISSNKEIFDQAAPPYQAALEESGYTHKLEFDPNVTNTGRKKNRTRRVTWFNPPFSSTVATNIGGKFLQIVDECFPPNSPLSKIFNRQTIKVSYRCMPNIRQVISKHNGDLMRKNLVQNEAPARMCNCQRGVESCPLNGECLTPGLVYQATVSTNDGEETYTGLTERRFKDRLYEHNHAIRNRNSPHETTLSTHTWKLKDEGTNFKVSWKMIERAKGFNPATNKCRLCLKEKFSIMFNPIGATLNQRKELYSTCRHKSKYYLCNLKT